MDNVEKSTVGLIYNRHEISRPGAYWKQETSMKYVISKALLAKVRSQREACSELSFAC
jgi:hypothetical protein